ncbi:hypothetical protein Q7P37_008006 [Cladosporium fusiforme]
MDKRPLTPAMDTIPCDTNITNATIQAGEDTDDFQATSNAAHHHARLVDISSATTETQQEAHKNQDNNTHQAQSNQLHVERRVWSSVKVDLIARTVERYDWNKSSLHPYRKFPKLLGERKFAHSDTTQRQHLSFLDLPGEIRNKIYMYTLNFESIELAAKTRFHHTSNGVRARHYRDYKEKIKPSLQLLRVNKQINQEASSIFYGQNEFRFTAICGHDILRAFCKTIGKANTLRITKITEHAPIDGDFEEIWDRPAAHSKTSMRNFNDWLSRKGLHQQGYLAGKFSVERAITGKRGSLREYKMVMPSTFNLSACEIASNYRCLLGYLSAAHSGVKVSLVLLDMQVFYPHGHCPQTMLREQCVRLADQRGWNVMKADSDRYGRYAYLESQRGGVEHEEVEVERLRIGRTSQTKSKPKNVSSQIKGRPRPSFAASTTRDQRLHALVHGVTLICNFTDDTTLESFTNSLPCTATRRRRPSRRAHAPICLRPSLSRCRTACAGTPTRDCAAIHAPAMALAAPPASERKRVKVYELKNNDWYDRGTGFCSGRLLTGPNTSPDNPEAHIVVVSEDEPERALLETRITKDDGYQKQQETLIVWTETNGVDMALSFQEAEGCSSIWEFVSEVQTRLAALAPDDGLSDDLLDPIHPLSLPDPQLGKLEEIENIIRAASQTPAGRDAVIKFIMSPEQQYILKLAPLVEMAEDLESLPDLHRLCTIMKHLILLNDTSIIEFVVTDQAVMGVVGALEYDPDFPSHRANHRQYLSDSSKFKQVVKIDNDEIRRKIHYTYRLLYLKDVVLARILDDPTFSVLNSLIFFHQVDIVNFLQSNDKFLRELFAISLRMSRMPRSRAHLYNNFIQFGLFAVVMFALRHHDASVRVAGTDILVSLIDHDPHMVRMQIFTAIKEKTTPLTDTLIELLLVEVDLGVKSQMADAIKILLDPSTTQAQLDMMNRAQNGDFVQKQRGPGPHNTIAPQTDAFISNFYEDSAKRLFQPLKDLEHKSSMLGLSVQELSLYTHLVEVLCFFVRQHTYKSKLFILAENLHSRVAQLLACPQKHMKLMALKWFRVCIGLQDEFHNRQLIQHRLFEPILNIVYETMPRDNLLNSACLELFEYIKRENIKQLIVHLVDHYRERLVGITYVNTFQQLIQKYEQLQTPYPQNGEESFTTQEGTPQRTINGQPYNGLRESDADEEAYFNGDDDMDGEDDDESGLPTAAKVNLPNGASPLRPLVSYPDDEEDTMDILASSPDPQKDKKSSSSDPTSTDAAAEGTEIDSPQEPTRGRDRKPVAMDGSPGQRSPSESAAPKRRREDDDEDDELGKLMSGNSGVKRRNSSAASVSTRLGDTMISDQPNGGPTDTASPTSASGGTQMLRRKGSLKTRNQGALNKFAFKGVQAKPEQESKEGEQVEGEEIG